MTESFADLFEESLKTIEMEPGSIVTGVVVAIDSDWVTVHAGLKSEGVIPRSQFLSEEGELEVAVGDEVKVALEAVEDGFGDTRLSREKAKRSEAWSELEKAYEAEEVVKGIINGKVKGGFTVDISSVRAFLPGSLVDIRPVRDTPTWKAKSWTSKLSNWTVVVTTSSYPVVPYWKRPTAPSVKNCWPACRKARSLRASSRT